MHIIQTVGFFSVAAYTQVYLNASNTFSQLNCTSKSRVYILRVVLLLQTNTKYLTDQSVLPLGLRPPLFLDFLILLWP